MKPKVIVTLIAAVVILGGTFWFLKAGADKNKVQPTSQTKLIMVDIVNDQLASGVTKFEVTQGQTVTIEATTDKALELHLHGYDKELELEPGKRVKATFVADKAGAFEAELHDTDKTIFVLNVEPR